LQVEGIDGYQAWRSPVVEVITQIVHVNVPYTPWAEDVAETVMLTPDGPDPAVITVSAGSAVEWNSALRASDTISNLIAWTENPILHPKSDLNPLEDTRGFDAGFLEPGRTYRRIFSSPGTYAYTDAGGHRGTVVVSNRKLYLPLVMKQ
jgi:plastocyanin